MLFYERRPSPKSSEKSETSLVEGGASEAKASTSCIDTTCDASTTKNEIHDTKSTANTSANDEITIETDTEKSEILKSNLETQSKTRNVCDIVSKDRSSLDSIEETAENKPKEAINDVVPVKPSAVLSFNRLNKELEDWIWQDNRHFLQDRNVFEHTYFK